MDTSFEDKVRACLGKIPGLTARSVLPLRPGADHVTLRYEWIKDWEVVKGLDFLDGSEWITFLKPLK